MKNNEFSAKRIAVIGAGMAGAVAARELHDAGHHVEVFDKSRGVGGRLSAKRYEGASGVDLGIPGFTAQGSDFIGWLRELESAGVATAWEPRQAQWMPGEGVRLIGGQRQWVGSPNMHALIKEVLHPLTVHNKVRITDIESHRHHLTPVSEESSYGNFDFIVVALPAPQAEPLLHSSPALQEYSRRVKPSPCWALAVELATPSTQPFDWLDIQGHRVLGRLVRDSAKPGRQHPGEIWTLYANRRWSVDEVSASKEDVISAMGVAFARFMDIPEKDVKPLMAHRWLYAQHTPVGDAPSYFDYQRKLAVCGDWLAGEGMEGAWVSGMSCAASVIAACGA
ncbi:NAD(P)/FAD-dependent oxidoreductase [Pokkaliibacter plantistimulans]|uniref:NAD(P)/FAD-dependent oxidoreductase n=1 Tax=Pokkaliibacter plantistimulans TaxID=1635171 RepID=UPI000D74E5AD|nr:NAD(P)-binding protein [Pokkaliibacter plantistimulans]